MAVVQLASVEDVVEALGRDLTDEETLRVGAILDKASELFRRRSGQQFTPGESLVKVKVNGGEVRLPQRPVVSVEAVTLPDGSPVEYTRFKSVLTTCLRSDKFVHVAYTHGGEAPDVVRLCIAEIAKKVLSISDKAMAGLTSSMTVSGPLTDQESYATWAQGGQTMLAPDDAALADSFRSGFGSVIVQVA